MDDGQGSSRLTFLLTKRSTRIFHKFLRTKIGCSLHVCIHTYMYMYVCTWYSGTRDAQTQSSVDISKSSFRLTYSLKMARGIFGADVLIIKR